MTVEPFVKMHLPPPPARVLEVGCGRGDLARALAECGYEVTAIDPEAPAGRLFQTVSLEEFVADSTFDAVVASRALHHISDLAESVATIAGLLRPLGRFVLDEHACDRLDAPTARWYFEQRTGSPKENPGSLEACLAEWADEHEGLHGYAAMRAELDSHFAERFFSWVPYLHGVLPHVDEETEKALIEAGSIQAMGFRYVGERRAPS